MICPDSFEEKLQLLKEVDNFRYIPPVSPKKATFQSNDYLGLTEDVDLLREFYAEVEEKLLPMGSGGSRLLGGNFSEATEFENDIAIAFGKESALIFNSGYHAGVGFFRH